ncbi:MAG: dienelactone hydrolase family protein [Candidatus Sumerlaeota bacterium]|nr:dienelactone hydrolase family protein [Candidatus Sumerlaeota bacterium]
MDNAIEKNSRRNASEASQGGPNSPATNTPGKAGTAPARAKAQPGNQTGAEKKAEVDESVIQLYEAREFQGMPYRLMKPIDFDPSTAYPLIVSLHGKGGVGTDNLGNLRVWTAFLAREELRRKHPCFVLAPQTPTSWTTDDEPAPVLTEDSIKNYPEAWRGFLQRRMTTQPSPPPARASAGGDLSKAFDLVAEIEYEFRIDRSRIYVLGHSMGGFGSWNAIWAKPEMFAAAIPTAGALMPWKDPKRFANVPIWAFHGSADPLVPVDFTREIFAAMKQCGGNMKYTEMQGVNHGCNVPAFQYTGDDAAKGWITQCSSDRCERESDIWDWLFNQKRP